MVERVYTVNLDNPSMYGHRLLKCSPFEYYVHGNSLNASQVEWDVYELRSKLGLNPGDVVADLKCKLSYELGKMSLVNTCGGNWVSNGNYAQVNFAAFGKSANYMISNGATTKAGELEVSAQTPNLRDSVFITVDTFNAVEPNYVYCKILAIEIIATISCSSTYSLTTEVPGGSSQVGDTRYITRPTEVTIKASAACGNPNVCGESTITIYRFIRDADGSNVSYTIVGGDVKYTPTIPGYYTYIYNYHPCGGSQILVRGKIYLYPEGDMYYVNGNVIDSWGSESNPVQLSKGTVTFKFDDGWGYEGAIPSIKLYNASSGVFVKESTPEQYHQSAVLEFDLTDDMLGRVYKCVYSLGGVAKSNVYYFTLAPRVVSASFKVGTRQPQSITSGDTYPVILKRNSPENIKFTYTDSWADNTKILVNGTSPANDTLEFNNIVTGSYIVQYQSLTDDHDSSTADVWDTVYSFTIVVKGLLGNDGYIVVNEKRLTESVVLARYNSNQLGAYVSGIPIAGDTDIKASYAWTIAGTNVTSSDYILSSSSDSAPTLKLYTPGRYYTVSCVITTIQKSNSTVLDTKTVSLGSYSLSCVAKAVAIIGNVSPDTNIKPGDTITVSDCEVYIPTLTGNDYDSTHVTYDFKAYDKANNQLGPDKCTIESVTVADHKLSVTYVFHVVGTYEIRLIATALQEGYSNDTAVFNVKINRMSEVTSIPYKNRLCIVLRNGDYISIVNRANSKRLFTNLMFSSGLDSIGICKFTLVIGNKPDDGAMVTYIRGGNNGDPLVKYDAESILVATGTEVIIFDNLCPVWSGIITSKSKANINAYNKIPYSTSYEIIAEESSRVLGFDYVPVSETGSISDTIDGLVKKIIPAANQGDIFPSKVSYSISLQSVSRLNALDAMSSQVGWKYRVRQSVPYYNLKTAVGQYYLTVTPVVDGMVVTTPADIVKDDIALVWTGEKYIAYIIRSSGADSNNKLRLRHGSATLPESVSSSKGISSVYHTFLIDYRPTYYGSVVDNKYVLPVNKYIQNVVEAESSDTQYGEVCVYGVGNSGEVLASNIRAWMKINKDYTIPMSAKISKSYDTEVDSVSYVGEVEQGGVTYDVFNIITNGWSLPSTMSSDLKPTLFYKTDKVRYLKLDYAPGGETFGYFVKKYQDNAGNMKSSFRTAVVKDEYDESAGDRRRKKSEIIMSMIPMTNLVFNTLEVVSDDNISAVFSGTNNITVRIGDSLVKATNIIMSGKSAEITFDWIYEGDDINSDVSKTSITPRIPHGHMTDVLVMEETATGGWSNPDPESPKKLYPNNNATIQGAEGYSMMEMEKLACRYMQYGTNYSDRCSADVIYQKFMKDDYNIGTVRIMQPGDRIALSSEYERNTETYNINKNYELISYLYDVNKNTVSITFGMPFTELNGVLYNMLSNSGMSIIPSSSDGVTNT